MSTFLALVQSAANELGIPEPSQVIGATDDTSKHLLALANREGKEFSQAANKNGGWQKLHKEYVFSTVGYSGFTGTQVSGSAIITGMSSTTNLLAGMIAVGNNVPVGSAIVSVDSGTQVTLDTACSASATGTSMTFGTESYALPSDFEYFITKTFWDKTYRWQLLGPLEAQEKDVIKYGISPVGPRRRFWIRNNKMYLNPIPTNITDQIAYDYYSKSWCQSSGGAAQSAWAADTDTYLLDEDSFILGLKYRFLRAKGLDYGQEYDDYTRCANTQMARDGGGRDLPLNAQSQGLNLLGPANIPDVGFGA